MPPNDYFKFNYWKQLFSLRICKFMSKKLNILAVLLAIASVSAFSRTCGEAKSVSLREINRAVSETCRQISGKNINPERFRQFKSQIEEAWEASYTVQCMASCGASSSCADEWTKDLINGALGDILPAITSAWCTSTK